MVGFGGVTGVVGGCGLVVGGVGLGIVEVDEVVTRCVVELETTGPQSLPQ